jgi:hypothetical protein
MGTYGRVHNSIPSTNPGAILFTTEVEGYLLFVVAELTLKDRAVVRSPPDPGKRCEFNQAQCIAQEIDSDR